MAGEYLFRRPRHSQAPWVSTQSATPLDLGGAPAPPPIAPSLPAVVRGALRAAATGYAILLSATPPDAGAAPIPASAPDRAEAPRRAARSAYDSFPATPADQGSTLVPPIAQSLPEPQRPRRAPAPAYDALLSATPRDTNGWSRVQGAGAASSGPITSLAVALPFAAVPGDLLLVAVTTGTAPTVSISDSAGNTYTLVSVASNTTGGNAIYVYGTIVATGGTGLTVTASLTASTILSVAVDEFHFPGPIALTGAATSSGVNGYIVCGPISTTVPSLDYGAASTKLAMGGVTGLQPGYLEGYFSDFVGSTRFGLVTFFRVGDNSGSTTPLVTVENSVYWAIVGATYSPAAAAVPAAAPDLARGPARAAARAYDALISATPRDQGVTPAPPFAAATPEPRGPRRAAAAAYELTQGQRDPVPPPPIRPSAPDRADPRQRAGRTAYEAPAAATPRDSGASTRGTPIWLLLGNSSTADI